MIRRRQLLQLSGASLLLGGCGTPLFESLVGRASEPLNQAVEQALFVPERLAPEFPKSAINPAALLVNSYNGTPEIDPRRYRLEISGRVERPLQLSLEQIRALPLTEMIIRHVCVEGWAAIVGWGGVRLSELVRLAGPRPGVRYVRFLCADGYYSTWDIASALHPQTLMAYRKNGGALAPANGAPLRLASAIKLGYKQSKWVYRIELLAQLTSRRGFWEDQGYEWYGGL